MDVGSLISVYSRSSKRWFDGYISKIFVDESTNQEWFIVKYGNNKSKRMQRFCTDLKVRIQQQSISQPKNVKSYNNLYGSNKIKYNKNDDDSDLSDLETEDRTIFKPMKQTLNGYDNINYNKPVIYNKNTANKHPIIIFGNDDAESVNLDDLPPVKFRW